MRPSRCGGLRLLRLLLLRRLEGVDQRRERGLDALLQPGDRRTGLAVGQHARALAEVRADLPERGRQRNRGAVLDHDRERVAGRLLERGLAVGQRPGAQAVGTARRPGRGLGLQVGGLRGNGALLLEHPPQRGQEPRAGLRLLGLPARGDGRLQLLRGGLQVLLGGGLRRERVGLLARVERGLRVRHLAERGVQIVRRRRALEAVEQGLQVGGDGLLLFRGGAQGVGVRRLLRPLDRVRLAFGQFGQPLLSGLEGLGARPAGLRAQDAAELLERGEHLLLGLNGRAIIAGLQLRLRLAHVRDDELLPAQRQRLPQRLRAGRVLRLQRVRQLQQTALDLLHPLARLRLLLGYISAAGPRAAAGPQREPAQR